MNPYPLIIKFSDFTLDGRPPIPPLPRSLHLTKSVTEMLIRNSVSEKSCGPADLWLNSVTTGIRSKTLHKSTDRPSHPDIPPTEQSRYCFAPLEEDVWIHWKHKNPELIKESKLELFCRIDGKLTRIWKKTFTWNTCPEEAKTLFKGKLTLFDRTSDEKQNTGLKDVALDFDKGNFGELFPGECLTAQFSTYQLKLSVVPKAETVLNKPNSVWMYFDILVHSIDLEWGDVSLLPKNRDDIDDAYKEKILIGKEATDDKPKVVGLEESVLLDLKDTAKEGHAKPASGVKHKVILTSNLFPVKKPSDAQNFETGDQTDFNEYKKLWGYGPRIPILAKVSIKTSDNKGTYKVPEVLMGARLLWDWDDNAPDRWSDAVTDGETPNFTKDFLDEAYHKRGMIKPINSCNCPESFGGKLDDPDPKAHIFPEQNAEDVFPYKVKSCETRKWAAFSYFKPKPDNSGVLEDEAAKEKRCKTGVIFQPSRMAGDKYKITVCLDFTPSLDSEAPLDAPDTVKQEAGEFEVFRRVNLYYLTYGNPNMNCNADTCLSTTADLYLKEANLILNYVRAPMDADFKTAYKNAKKRFLSDPFSYEKVGAYGWNLLFDYYLDDNFAPGSPPVNFKELDDSLRDIEEAFKKGRIFEFTNIDDRKTLFKERVISRNRAEGIQLTKDPKEKMAIFVKEGEKGFNNNDEIVGEASKNIGKIAIEDKPSFWEINYLEETSADKRYNSAIEVTINGTVVLVKYDRIGIKREVSVEIPGKAKTELKRVLNGCDQSNTPTIKFKSKDQPSENAQTRLKTLKKFIEDSVVNRKAWFERLKLEHIIMDSESEHKKVGIYDYFPLAFIPMIMTEYIKIKHLDDEGIFLLHIPGRTNIKDLAIATEGAKTFQEPNLLGGYFPEISKRSQGIVYISSLPPGPKVAANPSKRLDSIFSHEIAHALFLPHALKKTGMPPGGEKEKKHVKGGTCLMNYDLDSNRFCGLCMIRIRGWKTEDANYEIVEGKFEYKLTLEIGNINELFEEDVNTPKGRQERMQVLGLLNYPLDHPDLTNCYNYSWQKCQALFPVLTGANDPAIRTLFETEIKKMLVGTNGILPTDGQFARIRVPTFTTMYSLNHLEARIPATDQGQPQSKPFERLILSADRFETEEHFYKNNLALGKIPLLVKVKMRPKNSGLDWAAAPEAKGVDVHFKIVKPDDFSAAAGPGIVNVAGGSSYYNDMAHPPLKAKPQTFINTKIKPSSSDTPDATNTETRLGGKRNKIVFRQTRAEGFTEIERDTLDNLKVLTDDNGEAKVIFDASRIGGDAYKLCFFVGSPTQEKDVSVAGDDIVTTGTMIRWRTIRISNHYQVNNSTNVGNLPGYLKPGGQPTSPIHANHYGQIPPLDLQGHITKEFAKSYCEVILENAALNPVSLANEETNIRQTMNQLLATYPKYNSFKAVKGRQNVTLNPLKDNLLTDRVNDKTRRTFAGKTLAYPIELGSVSIRPWFTKVDPVTLKETEERTGIEKAVLKDEGCAIGDNGITTGLQEIVSKSINYATGDVRIVFKEQQQRNYQIWYKPLTLIDPAVLLHAPFPPQTPYLINLKLPDDYNAAIGPGIPAMEKDAQGNLPSGNNHYLMIDAPTLGLGKGLFLDSIARGINLNNGFNPGLIIVEAQWLDNLTAVADPGGSQEGKAVGQTVFIFTGAKTATDRYKALTIHEMSHALYLQHAPGGVGTSGVRAEQHDDDPTETCVMSYGDNDGDHCGKCIAALRGMNIRNI